MKTENRETTKATREKVIAFRVTFDQADQIQRNAKSTNLPVSAYLARKVFEPDQV
jgi:hypothetical protein